MDKSKNETPKQVILTPKEMEGLKKRVENSGLAEQDINLILGLFSFNAWIQERLLHAKLTIKRLRQIFGFKSESKKKITPPDDSGDSEQDTASDEQHEPDHGAAGTGTDDPDDGDENKTLLTVPQWDPSKNHGRYGHSDYTGCPKIDVPLEDEKLKRGYCPECAKSDTIASVSLCPPKVIVLLESTPLISGNRYCLEQARCNVCHKCFTAQPLEEMEGKPKYSITCYTVIAIYHYYAGLPFKRIEMLQKAQGIPLADATQSDMMDRLYHDSIMPIFLMLLQYSAQGKSLFFDDTPGKILDQMAENKQVTKRSDKKSVHTTAFLVEHEGHRICIFQTNTMTAGKELASLLEMRTSDEDFNTMSDASPHNFPKLKENLMAKWIISLCLCHSRRKFVELIDDTDDDTTLVIDTMAQVYRNEAHCKKENLDDNARLAYHQTHSEPLMEALRTWLNNLLLYKHVEPNSRLGKAISHLLKRWFFFTQFLRVPGAELDNNPCEQIIKVAIRYRKNSLFYKTTHGANIGDAMMSVLHTCVQNNIDIFDYLNTVQQHKEEVNKSPWSWLPWNYHKTLATLAEPHIETVNSG